MSKLKRWNLDINDKPYMLSKIWQFTIFFERVTKESYKSGYIEYKFYKGNNNLIANIKDDYLPKYIKKQLNKIAEIVKK